MTIADGGDAMQRPLDSGTVVGVEFTNARGHGVYVISLNLIIAEGDLGVGVTSGGYATEVEDYLQQIIMTVDGVQLVRDFG
jgi:hypothetical protein